MDWRPFPRQEMFLILPYYEVLFGGAKGGGKSDCLLTDASAQLNTPGYKAIIFRRTYPRLQELIDKSFRMFSGKGKYSSQDKRWTFTNKDGGKSYLSFAHCQNENDKYNHQGQEYHYIGFDQLEEFTESVYLYIIAQNRTTNPAIKCYIRATANPGNIGHAWVKKRFVDKLDKNGEPKYFKRINDEDVEVPKGTPYATSRAYVFSTVDDNPAILNNDPGYVSRLEMLPDAEMKALRHGDWDSFAGQFFKDWSSRIHVISGYDYSGHTIALGMDYGYSKPSSVGWYAFGVDDTIVRFAELYTEGKTYEELGREISLKNALLGVKPDYMVADPAIWGDKAHHSEDKEKEGHQRGLSGAEVMQNILDFPIVQADNRRIVGWNRFRERLKPYENQQGQITAHFLVTENCKNFIRTIPCMIYDETVVEDLNSDGEDHAVDEARYIIMSRPKVKLISKEPETKEEKFWERVKKDLIDTEPTYTKGEQGESLIMSEGERLI